MKRLRIGLLLLSLLLCREEKKITRANIDFPLFLFSRPFFSSFFLSGSSSFSLFDTMPRPAAAVAHGPTISPKPPYAQPAAATAGDDDEQGSSGRTCRICWCGEEEASVKADNVHGSDASGMLIAPCLCKGTCELVHLG